MRIAIHFLLISLAGCDAVWTNFAINNPQNCILNANACTGADSCDQQTGKCSAMAPCTADAQCEARSKFNQSQPAQNYCVDLNGTPTCVECRGSASPNDCRTPGKAVCNNSTLSCRPCYDSSDCISGLCAYSGMLPDIPIAQLSNIQTGECIYPSQISFVQKSGTCSDTGPGTVSQPFCSLAPALSRLSPFIALGPNGGIAHPPFTVNGGYTRVIVGTGRDTGATLLSSASVTDGTLVLSAVSIGPVAGPTLTCSNSSGNLYVLKSKVYNGIYRGIDASVNCGSLTVERSIVIGNGSNASGIVIGNTGSTTTNFRIVNSAVIRAGTFSGGIYGVYIGLSAQGTFAYNTITGNSTGVGCDVGKTISDSIVSGNNTQNIYNCNVTRVASGAVNFTALSDGTPMLMDTTTNSNCCIDKGQSSSSIIRDFNDNRRPIGNGYDIGYNEIR